ncbi:tonB-dependent receptor family protein [Asticcacaulis biprosthecium C19]|uniref:TonB-dependent receptor family protein n=1 Tax=Asticcacaulis biprosthecium C19 TaxID=715226 RepID=F4QTE0_9CAUL|nr:TonB-dependent receptor [Asticcacaulis biprosthecium]EGF90010.1 tonB-dependent receptor family protein [Asticcacaulis biprosthecium C19]
MKSKRDESVQNQGVARRSRLSVALLGSTALAAALLSTAAFAQDAAPAAAEAAPPADDTVVVVTGIRGALQSASSIKRKASTFVDSITASDVSALPDLSVAEALQRVPGVTVTRFTLGGSPDFPSPEGRGNLIRGLGFVRSEFNGRDAFSANAGRALEWSSIPPQLVGGVDVYKNSSADLIEGGIGGTINLRTLEPFDRKGYFASVSADFNYGDLAKKWSPSYNAMIGNRWQTDIGEFGLMGSYSTSKLLSRIEGWQQPAPIPRVIGANGNSTGERLTHEPRTTTDPIAGAMLGFQMRTNDVDRNRDSFYIAGQWKNDNSRLTAKYIRVDNETQGVERTLESFPGGNNNQLYSFSNAVYDTSWSTPALNLCNDPNADATRGQDYCEKTFATTGGLMQSGLITKDEDSWFGAYGLHIDVLSIGKTEKSTTEDLSLNYKWRPTDRLYVELDAQQTKATASVDELWGGTTTFAMAQIAADLDNPRVRLTIDPRTRFSDAFNGNGGYVSTPITGTDDPSNTFWKFNSQGHQRGTGELTAFRADVQYDFEDNAWFKSVKFGVRTSERSQVNKQADLNWGGIGPRWGNVGLGTLAAMDSSLYEKMDFADFYRDSGVLQTDQGGQTKFAVISSELLLNPEKMLRFMQADSRLSNPDGTLKTNWTTQLDENYQPIFNPANVSTIVEKTDNVYLMANFGHDFDNGMSLDGNFGLRYTSTKLNSEGFLSYRSIDADPQTASTTANPRTPDAESRDSVQDFLPETTSFMCPGLSAALTPTEQAAPPNGGGWTPATARFRGCPEGQIGKSEAQSVNIDDEHWLPSFNVKWNLNEDMLIRFGASKNISRPNIQDMRAGQQMRAVTARLAFPVIPRCVPQAPATTCTEDPLFGVDRGASSFQLEQMRVTGGNPRLKPTTSINYDLSWEWYFQGGTVSTAFFKKELKNIIQSGDETLGSMTLDGKTVSVVYGGLVNQETADIQGVELAYQQFYDFLPGWMSHLGMQANFTYIDASAAPPPPFVDADGDGTPDSYATIYRFGVNNLLGQSKYILNVVGIYQDDKWEGRLAYNWRDENLTTYRDYITGGPIFNSAVGFLDGSIKYDVNQKLQVSLNASNLLDTKNKAEAQISADGQRVDRFSFLNDRRFVLSVRYQY